MPFGLTAMRTAGLGFDVGQAADNAPHGRLPIPRILDERPRSRSWRL